MKPKWNNPGLNIQINESNYEYYENLSQEDLKALVDMYEEMLKERPNYNGDKN